MDDVVIGAIESGSLHRTNISFAKIRSLAARACGLHGELEYGRAIIQTCDHLDQYLLSYGPFTEGEWATFLHGKTLPGDKCMHVVAYGCGQGLGLAMLLDTYGAGIASLAAHTVLIEPSAIALARARHVMQTYAHIPKIYTMHKDLNAITPADLRLSPDCTNLHIFSNVLDVEGFDTGKLFSKMFQTAGSHIVLAVSHDREHHGGSPRIRALESAVRDKKNANWLTVDRSEIRQFTCPNDMKAISWDLRVTVSK